MNQGKTVVISCETLENELGKVMAETGISFPVVWIERQLHSAPARLNEKLLCAIHDNADADTILFSMAICGNAFDKIGSETSELVIPRFPDCIGLLLDSSRDQHTFYLTDGWMQGNRSFPNEYRRTVKKCGPKMANMVFASMLKTYTSFTAIETGAYDPDALAESAAELCSSTGLPLKRCPGTTDVLKKLLRGQWDDDFIRLKPGEFFEMSQIASGELTLKNAQIGDAVQ